MATGLQQDQGLQEAAGAPALFQQPLPALGSVSQGQAAVAKLQLGTGKHLAEQGSERWLGGDKQPGHAEETEEPEEPKIGSSGAAGHNAGSAGAHEPNEGPGLQEGARDANLTGPVAARRPS